ncbi:HNH endonuclease family protein [Amycolatopsis sp. NPDC059021]|uniref:HNH endonuclease family protein n=1 Tax=Amycolatopsis sp. NPDC059021 TaxID=3346704 RepID=UPI00366BB578
MGYVLTTHTTLRTLAVTVPLVLAAALAASCKPLTTPAAPAAPTAAGAAGTGSGGQPADVGAARRALAGLRVAPEDTGVHYNREDWPHWTPVSGECDAREQTLKTQGRNVTTGAHCRVTGGTWTSPYDGVTVTTPGALDIDHMVPLAEAARSGTRGWSREQRQRYANDTAVVLVAVTAKSNRAKGDQDPAKWLPALDRCGYVARWVTVKAKYAMTLDQREHDAIAGILAHC